MHAVGSDLPPGGRTVATAPGSCSARGMTTLTLPWAVVLVAAIAACEAPRTGPVGQPLHIDVAAPVVAADALAAMVWKKGELLYVPAYSSIYATSAHRTLPLTVTLSVRNVDPDHEIVLRSARYFDTAGKLLKENVPAARLLPPLATYEHVVEFTDETGGTGANFLVEWTSTDAAAVSPLVETVHLQTVSGRGVSFTSRGVVVKALAFP